MKHAHLGLAALAVVAVWFILRIDQAALGQVTADPVPVPPPSISVAPVAQHAPAGSYPAPAYLGVMPAAPDPELGKLMAEEGRIEHETAGLIQEYSRSEDESQRSKTKAKLAATLEKQFDLQQKRRDLEVARIEAQLKKLRDIMRKRGESRQTIIDKRLDQLLREADGLGWTTPPAGTVAPRVYAPNNPTGQLQRR